MRIEHCELALPSAAPEAHYTVYKLTDPEGKVYIGCTGKTVEERWRNGWHYNCYSRIYKAIRKFGWVNIEKKILCEKLTREGAEKLEKWFIAYYDSANPEKGYNRALGGLGKGSRMSEATKKLLSDEKFRKYREDPDYRERVRKGVQVAYENDPQYREKLRISALAYYEQNPESKSRISKMSTSLWQQEDYRKKTVAGMLKVREDPALAQNLQMKMKKFYDDHPEKKEEIRRRMMEYLSKPENRAFPDCDNHPKPVICIETGEYYPSQKAAEKATGFSKIHNVCEGKRCTAGGYHWRYA